MSQYRHVPLETPEEIRLITILPGEFGDPVLITIKHQQLSIPPAKDEPQYPSIKDIAGILPTGWAAYTTLEGRTIFKGPSSTSWTHPDPSYNGYDFSEFEESRISNLEYEALSYTWGSDANTENVFVVRSAGEDEQVDDELAAKFAARLNSSAVPGTADSLRIPETLKVRQNLAEALRYLRYSDRPRTMWIDAISINQNDVIERNKQVPRMGDIYKLARKVVAWLGLSFLECGTAYSALEYLGRQVEFTRNNQCLQSPGCVEKDWYELRHPLPFDDGTWESIYTLLCRPWFRRCWILQEIYSASAESVIKCGVYEIPWPLFRRAVLSIENMNTGVPWRVRNLPSDVYRINNHVAIPFEFILLKHHARYCSNPRDKIYAFISLAPKNVGQSLCVEYGLPVMDVYKEAFLACWQAAHRVDSLGACGMLETKKSSPSPTWVPDWTTERPDSVPLDSGFCCSGISASHANYRAPGQLVVDGLAVTSIIKTENPDFEEFEDVVGYLRSLDVQRLLRTAYCAGGTMLDAYLRILSAGILRDRVLEPSYPSLFDLRRVFTQGDTLAQGEVEFEGNEPELTEFWKDAVLSWLRSSWLLTTEEGYIGFSSASGIQEGKALENHFHRYKPLSLFLFKIIFSLVSELVLLTL
jgi:hypothetical protein